MKELAKLAIDVQDACNLSGVVHSFSTVISELRNDHNIQSTNDLNTHPICVLFADKINQLTSYPSETWKLGDGNFGACYNWCIEVSHE
jgi:hypothetical protein